MNPFNADAFLATSGMVGLCVLIFIETGLLAGFLFPGDSLLFTAGIFAAQPDPFAHLWVLLIALPLSAIVGDQLGYLIGRQLGAGALSGRLMRVIGEKQLDRTRRFFGCYGAATVFFGRFLGIVRTLVPVVAGITGMRYAVFTMFSVLGSVVWAGGLVIAGYMLGNVSLIRNNIELIVIGSVLTVVVPTAIHIGRTWWRARQLNREPLPRRPLLEIPPAEAESELHR